MTSFSSLGIKQVQLYWRGDPCPTPKLPEIAEVVKWKGLTPIVSTTGVTRYNRDKKWMTRLLQSVDYYAVCLDGWNPENIHKYRVGSKWEAMFNNLDMLNDIESNTEKILAVLMFKQNEGHEDFFEEVAQKYNMRLDLKAPDILGHHVLPDAIAEEWLATKPESSIETIRQIREDDMQLLDPGVRRIMNPHIYHVSLTQRLWDLKQNMVESFSS